jgi:uncharacterized Fe-S center protein
VALDVACADMANRAPVLAGSYLEEKLNSRDNGCCEHDHFVVAHPETNWRACVEHAEKIGIGRQDYELIEI